VLERHHRFGWFHGVADQRVIENAIAPDWPRAPGPRPAVAERPLRLGYLGRLDATKGLDTLLEAVRHLPAGAFELHIAGPGDPAWVREDLERHGLGPAVRLHGVVKPAPFLDGIDVLVTPSRAHETFCNVVMEAGCLGIPAIVSDRGALPERVEQGASGWIFPAGDAQALARVLHQCLDHPADVAARGAVALQSRPRYEPAHQAQAWSTLCRDLATRSGAAA
jgi:glycogen synthase